jgi:hypothetical protein
VIVQNPDGTATEVHDGDRVPLVKPPQGGRVLFAGVRVRNIDGCSAHISGALHDPIGGANEPENRTLNLTKLDGGLVGSVDVDSSSYSNIPVCPNNWAKQDLYEKPFPLTVTVTDRKGRVASATFTVTPFCAEPALRDECLCICKQGYSTDVGCADGGVDGGP